MGRHSYPRRHRTPTYRAARGVSVPIIVAVLAVTGLATRCSTEGNAWQAPRTVSVPGQRIATSTSPITSTPKSEPSVEPVSTTPPPRTTPAPAAVLRATATSPTTSIPAAPTTASSPGTPDPYPSDWRRHRKFSTRSDTLPESIQPCQRSAAACFESGGLGELASNLQVMKIDPVTGRFCFAFQPECDR